jgi:hypothetical protein
MTPRPPNRSEIAAGNRLLAPRQAPQMRLLSFRPMVKGALRGFATVELPIGLKIYDVPVLVGRNGAWANLPAKPRLDQDRRQEIGPDGKPAYSAILEWHDRDLQDRFSAAVVELVRSRHPEALDGAEP